MIYDTIRAYFNEALVSRFTFNPVNARRTVDIWLANPDIYVMRHEAGGLFVLYCCALWSDEREGYVDMFYVSPKVRGTRVARELVVEIENLVYKLGLRGCYTDSRSGFDNKLFRNLFAKKDFKVIGDVMYREY